MLWNELLRLGWNKNYDNVGRKRSEEDNRRSATRDQKMYRQGLGEEGYMVKV